MAIRGVSKTGKLSLLSTVQDGPGAHCAAADDNHQVWVCDPDHGQAPCWSTTLPGLTVDR